MATKITVRDIAGATGVSIGTVSRALRNQPGLSDTTRDEIARVAQAMGYDLGKLRSSKPRRLLFLFSRQNEALSANPFYSVVLHGVEQACSEANVSLSLLSLGPAGPPVGWVRQYEPDALLSVGYFDPAVMAQLAAANLPMVAVDHQSPGCRSVNDDNAHGAWLATRHLFEQGCQRVAFIAGPMTHHSVALRAKGFRRALFESARLADPELEVMLDANLGYADAAKAAMRHLLALPQRPDGVFAYNDMTALSAMEVCVEAGLSIPGDVAFIGYDDIAAAASNKPALSTIMVDKIELGRRAAELLIKGDDAPGDVLLPVELVTRASSLRGVAVPQAASVRRKVRA